jgi:non-ribosomal peptide synthetase-like protein
VVPLAYSVGVGYAIVNSVMPYVGNEDWAGMFWHLAMSGALYGLGSMVFVLLLKWIFIGRYKPSAHPMWTPFVWFSEAVTNMYESMAVMSFLNYLRGTPMLPWALRLYGAKVGKYVYLDTTDMTEYDCVTVGDHAELNNLCGPQTHLFEDRIMKIGNVVIERGEVWATSRFFQRDVVGDNRHRVGLVGADEGVQVGVISARVFADQRCFAVARCLRARRCERY